MARRRKRGLKLIVALPWPVGVLMGIAAYLLVRYGVGWYFSGGTGPLASATSKLVSAGSFAPLAWVLMLTFWLAAGVSFAESRRRARLLDAQTGLDSLRALDWRQFELLVGEAFRRRGYLVVETGLGGKDGGVDLIVRKTNRNELVQCKQWRNRQVDVTVVREMYGLLAHHGADAVKIVSIGTFTHDAATFASGKPIELITGEDLLALVREVQTTRQAERAEPVEESPDPATTPGCPLCGAAMLRRVNRKTGQTFWGCCTYPGCRGTRKITSLAP